MKTLVLDYKGAHDFVSSSSKRGYTWNGWDIVRWVPNPTGYSSQNGQFKNGMWGIAYTYPVSNDGTWTVKVPENVQFN
jgi:hypothetical protein